MVNIYVTVHACSPMRVRCRRVYRRAYGGLGWPAGFSERVTRRRRPSAGQAAAAAVELVLLSQIQLLISCRCLHRVSGGFKGSHLSLRPPGYQVWHSNRDYEYLTAQRGSGEVQWSRARWGHERSGSAGSPVRCRGSLSAVLQRKHPGERYR